MKACPESPTRAISRSIRKAEDEEEENQDLGQEDDHRADAADDAVDEKRAQRIVGERLDDFGLQRREQPLDPGDRRRRPGEHRLEHQEHDRGEDQRAGQRMEHDTVDRVAPAADRHRLDHRHAELLLEPLRIEDEAVAAGKIHHVERDHGGQAERDQLQREAQMIVEVACVEDDEQSVRKPLALLAADDDVASHFLVGTRWVEAIGAGKIDQLDRTAVGEREAPRFALDGDAGIIADLLPCAGEHVEQGALAGIGIADDRDQRDRGHLFAGSTETARAWARRTAIVIRPSRIASGSRPNGAACSASISTPSSKPRLRSRRASDCVSDGQSIPVTMAGVRNGSWSRLSIMSTSCRCD
jgi:hypothetical protein